MKTNFLKLALCAMALMPMGAWAQTITTILRGQARSWDFTNWSTTTKTNLNAAVSATAEWSGSYQLRTTHALGELTANGVVIGETKGLNIYGTSGGTFIYTSGSYVCLRFKGNVQYMQIPNLKKDQVVTIKASSTSTSNQTKIATYEDYSTNVSAGTNAVSTGPTDKVDYTFTINTDGDYSFKVNDSGDNSMYIYSVSVSGLSTITETTTNSWDFTSWDADDLTAISNDANYRSKWGKDEGGTAFYYPNPRLSSAGALTAKGTDIPGWSGLQFIETAQKGVRLYPLYNSRSGALLLNVGNASVVIPSSLNLQANDVITFAFMDGNAGTLSYTGTTGTLTADAGNNTSTATFTITTVSDDNTYSFANTEETKKNVFLQTVIITRGETQLLRCSRTALSEVTISNLNYACETAQYKTGSDLYYYATLPASSPWRFVIDDNECTNTTGLTFSASANTDIRIRSNWLHLNKDAGKIHVSATSGDVIEFINDATNNNEDRKVCMVLDGTQSGITADAGNVAGSSSVSSKFNVTANGTYLFKSNNSSYDNRLKKIYVTSTESGFPVTISSAGYATLSYPAALNIPSGITAYFITAKDGSEVTATSLANLASPLTYIPANQGVILQGDPGTYYFTYHGTETYDGTNYMKANLSPTQPTAETYYTLAVSGAEPIFKLSSGGVLAANKAYLDLSGVAARELNIDFSGSETTALREVKSGELRDNSYYNLAGQRVVQPTKGLYIVNGKKVVIK